MEKEVERRPFWGSIRNNPQKGNSTISVILEKKKENKLYQIKPYFSDTCQISAQSSHYWAHDVIQKKIDHYFLNSDCDLEYGRNDLGWVEIKRRAFHENS